ncbi:F-box protein CPR1-like [Hibiscus syriacus]|uniref:F-box protein CPR1-like n=1 Tax=Hibiscus syriacus TaxID=106335 RepID=UPI0019250107|nr:F-box protein CPR1-like [Hibiscus syriacus]
MVCWPVGFTLGDASKDRIRNTIVGFDLGTEELIEVPQPNCADKSYLLDVGVLEGRLCVVCNYDQEKIDAWVMKEYGG